MFESMAAPLSPVRTAPAHKVATLGELRQQIRRLEHGQLPAAIIPVLPGLDSLFPEGGLKPGVAYCVSSHTSVVWALIAQATQQGHWVASVGLDHLGFQAAVEYGVLLERLIVLPRIGGHCWSAVASLVDVVSLVVVSSEGPVPTPATRDTLLARARERGCALLVSGQWPHAHGYISVEDTQWSGLGQGHGVLTSHELTLHYTPRHGARSHRVTLIRDGMGRHVRSHPVTPVRQLTPRTREVVVAADDRRVAG